MLRFSVISHLLRIGVQERPCGSASGDDTWEALQTSNRIPAFKLIMRAVLGAIHRDESAGRYQLTKRAYGIK